MRACALQQRARVQLSRSSSCSSSSSRHRLASPRQSLQQHNHHQHSVWWPAAANSSRTRCRAAPADEQGAAAGGDSGSEQQQSPQPAQDAKRAAAELVLQQFISSNSTVAFGNGELVNTVIAQLGDRLLSGKLENVSVVAASSTAAHEAAFFGVPQLTLEGAGGRVDLLVDQVDQFDEASEAAAALKGIRAEPTQPELPRLREALAAADRVVLLVEGADVVPRLGGSLPVFIDAGEAGSADWEEPAEALDDLFLGDAEVWRRPASGTANPRGGNNPYVAPEGNCNILDVRFYEGLALTGDAAVEYEQVAAEIEAIPGVVAHGLLLGQADAVVVVPEGSGAGAGAAPRLLERQRQRPSSDAAPAAPAASAAAAPAS